MDIKNPMIYEVLADFGNNVVNLFRNSLKIKSFILKENSHRGYSSCTNCCQEGTYGNDRVCFLKIGSAK